MPDQKFPLGRVMATPAASLLAERYAPEPHLYKDVIQSLLDRHTAGDWGTLDAEDVQANTGALDPADPGRILSNYYLDGEQHQPGDPGDRIWIITDYDRSATTVLLPGEY